MVNSYVKNISEISIPNNSVIIRTCIEIYTPFLIYTLGMMTRRRLKWHTFLNFDKQYHNAVQSAPKIYFCLPLVQL